MNDSPELPDLVGHIQDIAEFVADPKKAVAQEMVKRYAKTSFLAATALPLVLVAPNMGPTISTQQPIRKPDEHIVSQSHSPEAVMESKHILEDTMVSVVQAYMPNSVEVRGRKKAQVLYETFSQPLPLIAATELDKPEDSDNVS